MIRVFKTFQEYMLEFYKIDRNVIFILLENGHQTFYIHKPKI